ncbi:GAF and ANTAR domain-containing protein [Agromyces sp. Marseille-P2726]|uniref:GAF and ANTAR domain-containing protein n=1 Tax=Agromyces sp. Marseille-P2726 TaxID=2709132 RepID=UPI0020C23968|nr:GAF and ANTAR domain-containing protein [Agromyces sp. Marseille-P2726]
MTGGFSSAMESLERAGGNPGQYCRPFLDVFPVTGASVATVGALLGSETIAASDHLAARLDELQFDLGEGPCWDALVTGAAVLEPDLRDHQRRSWPAFRTAIAQDDVRAIFAFPLAVGPLRMGAVDLYSAQPVRLDRTQTRQADAMAAIVGRHVLRSALATVDRESEPSSTAYSRRLVHQATGMVLAQLGITPDDALLVIEGRAFAESRSVMDVARDILSGLLDFAPTDEGIGDAG